MKLVLLSLLISLHFNVKSQDRIMTFFGSEKSLTLLDWNSDNSKVIGVGYTFKTIGSEKRLWQFLYCWDAISGKLESEINLSELQKVEIDGKSYSGEFSSMILDSPHDRLIIFGRDYQCCYDSKTSRNFMFIVPLNNSEIKRFDIPLSIRPSRLAANSTNSNEIAMINAKKGDSTEVILFDVDRLEKTKTTLSTKRPFVPLTLQYSKSSENLFVGYHIGINKGGFYIWNLAENTKIKDVMVGKELPIHFWERNDSLYISTEYGKTVCYNSKYVKLWEKNIGISGLNPSGKYGLQIDCYYNELLSFRGFNTRTKTNFEIDKTIVLQPKFNATGDKILAITRKSDSNSIETNTQMPSAIIFDFKLE